MLPRLTALLLTLLPVAGWRTQASELRFDPGTASLYLRESADLPEQLLGTFRFVTRRAGAGDEARLGQVVPVGGNGCRLVGVEGLGYVQLEAEPATSGLRLAVDLAPLNRRGGLFRPVIELARAGGSDLRATDGGTKSSGSRSVSRVDLGTTVLRVEFDPRDVARTMVAPDAHTVLSLRWHSKVVETAPAAAFVLEMHAEDRPPRAAAAVLGARLQERLAALEARLQAWDTLLRDDARTAAEPMRRASTRLLAAVAEFREEPWAALGEMKTRHHVLDGEVTAAEHAFAGLVEGQRLRLQAAAKMRLGAMAYRVGLAYDADPAAEFMDWALFRMGLFRLAVNPVWHEGKDRAARTEIVQRALAAAKSYGMRAVLSVYEEKTARNVADLTFTNEFVPSLRSGFHEFGFNSARMRDLNLNDFDYWLKATARPGNIESYKIDNEPFWSTQAYPVFGYDEATVGCAPETFVAAVQARYGSFAEWRKRVTGTVADAVVPWHRWDDMRLAPGEARGLTFVAYLRKRYGTLERLNAVWGSSYHEWKEVFPPLPQVVAGRLADDSGAPEFDLGGYRPPNSDRPRPAAADLIAWRDWLRFWPHNINDELREFVALARDRGVKVPVGTNCVGGSTLNNAGDLAVSNAMFPWITPDGLGMVAIDFYQPGYLQGYLRAVVGAAQGRPAEIHETGGSDSKEDAWFMSAYAFAYGARGLLFWRRDHQMPATSALGVAEAIDLLGDADLADRSRPRSDGVVMVYPLETLYGEEARTGTAAVTLGNVQGALIVAKRQQTQYELAADRDLPSVLSASAAKCVVFPTASWLSDDALAAVGSFLQRGGAVILTDDFGRRDENGRLRPPEQLAAFRSSDRVLVLPERAFFDLRRTIRAPERSPQFGLAGDETGWEQDVRAFLQRWAPAAVSLRDAGGKLLRTNLAVRTSDKATYVFIDPWTTTGFVHRRGPVSHATDLRTKRHLAVEPVAGGVRVAIPGGATILRLAP